MAVFNRMKPNIYNKEKSFSTALLMFHIIITLLPVPINIKNTGKYLTRIIGQLFNITKCNNDGININVLDFNNYVDYFWCEISCRKDQFTIRILNEPEGFEGINFYANLRDKCVFLHEDKSDLSD